MAVARQGREIVFCRICKERGIHNRALPGKKLCAACWEATEVRRIVTATSQAETEQSAVYTAQEGDWHSFVEPVCNALEIWGTLMAAGGCVSAVAGIVWSASGGGPAPVTVGLVSLVTGFWWRRWHQAGAQALELLALMVQTNTAVAPAQHRNSVGQDAY